MIIFLKYVSVFLVSFQPLVTDYRLTIFERSSLICVVLAAYFNKNCLTIQFELYLLSILIMISTKVFSLDLSAMFNTIGYRTKLQTTFGIYATALSWLKSYLLNHSHTVQIHRTICIHTLHDIVIP